ncbi:hypothetical protein [Candidatus Chromulinivorax destructor]|uniref:Uncharacterized protein n=1 Tax=Candidatus Chromulinivorax destructor TaxID=2066483 RepID=A0A345ZBA8_9BACT|nr:hypothetical protein [Candidatus Chromulinivorax destructor]AXK60575.1 hypothetical protein C0J27_02345 [Candidatus Chromulinivorax destructor]
MNLKLIIIFSILLSHNVITQAARFEKTREEEIKEVVITFHQNHPDRSIEDLYVEIEDYGVGPQFIPFNSLIGQEHVLVDQGEYLVKYNLIPDMIATFNQLKIMMDIPEEVELWMENSDLDKTAHYNAIYRRIEVFPSLFTHVPSERIFILIHELTHVLQHKQEGLLIFNKPTEKKAFEYEYEADSTAAKAISCPVCFEMIIDQAFLGKEYYKNNLLYDQGYLSWQNLQKYKHQKLWKDTCSVHITDIKVNKELRLLTQSKKRRMHKKEKQCEHSLKLDFQASRLMQGRLSTVKFDS